MKYCFVLWTRPEIIKMYSTIKYCDKHNLSYIIIHTNQHYSENMDKVFFEELKLPQPHYNLWVNGGSHGEMTGRMLIEIEKILLTEMPDVVFVQWDTNSVLAGGLAAAKLWIKVAHIEAGLRSYDRTMPEEVNRIIVDHISDYLFVPTVKQREILLGEWIDDSKIFVVWNSIVDAVNEVSQDTQIENDFLAEYDIEPEGYIFFTTHRPNNVDSTNNLETLLESVKALGETTKKKVIFSVHPRTFKKIHEFGLQHLLDHFTVIEPVWFKKNILFQKNAFLTITDSWGMQEESCILQTKTLVLRENTERPETIDVWGAILVGNDKMRILDAYDVLRQRDINWYNPFGDGTTWEKMILILS